MSEYADRDVLAQGAHYTKHVMAMTAEGLHDKADIAAELAHRDMAIDQLRAERDAMRATVDGSRLLIAELKGERDALRLEVGVLRSQILGERVGMGCIDGASFPQALSIALQTESAMNNAMKAKK